MDTEKGEHMPIALRWTSAALALLPDDGKRYEIIDGELYVSRPPLFQTGRLARPLSPFHPTTLSWLFHAIRRSTR